MDGRTARRAVRSRTASQPSRRRSARSAERTTGSPPADVSITTTRDFSAGANRSRSTPAGTTCTPREASAARAATSSSVATRRSMRASSRSRRVPRRGSRGARGRRRSRRSSSRLEQRDVRQARDTGVEAVHHVEVPGAGGPSRRSPGRRRGCRRRSAGRQGPRATARRRRRAHRACSARRPARRSAERGRWREHDDAVAASRGARRRARDVLVRRRAAPTTRAASRGRGGASRVDCRGAASPRLGSADERRHDHRAAERALQGRGAGHDRGRGGTRRSSFRRGRRSRCAVAVTRRTSPSAKLRTSGSASSPTTRRLAPTSRPRCPTEVGHRRARQAPD